jgi:hypothetical protein
MYFRLWRHRTTYILKNNIKVGPSCPFLLINCDCQIQEHTCTSSTSVGIRTFGEFISANHLEVETIQTCLNTRPLEMDEIKKRLSTCKTILHGLLQEEAFLGKTKFFI